MDLNSIFDLSIPVNPRIKNEINEPSNPALLYRVNEFRKQEGMEIYFESILINKRTPKGVWVYDNTKFIKLSAKKKWAYPSRPEALFAFIKRKERQILILTNKLDNAKESLSLSKEVYESCA